MAKQGSSVVKKCSNCVPHEYQDKKYGDKMRVHNVGTQKGTDSRNIKCSVCGKQQVVSL